MVSLFDIRCCGPPVKRWSVQVDDDRDIAVTASDLHHRVSQRHRQQSHKVSPRSLIGEEEAEVRRRIKEEKEALGWTLDASARGVAVMGTAVFVSSELLRLAKEAAGCESDNDACENRVYGMKPTSVLTNIMTVVGFISAFLMPLLGSVIDHTAYRRAVGRISGGIMAFSILVQMLLLPNYWFAASIMQIVVAFSYMIHLTVVYAYLPELTTSAERLVNYTAQFTAAQYSSSVLFLILMVIILSVAPDNLLERYGSIYFSQTVIVFVCMFFMGYAWTFLFRKRPASQHVPEQTTLLTAGFYKIFQTSRTIWHHHSAIKWFLVSVAFTEAATYTFSTIAITYMTDQLNFTSRENGICILILLLFGVPGTRLASWTNGSSNPVRSLQACLILWIATTSLAAFVMKAPGQENLAYVFAMFWGLGLGWIHPTEKTLYCTIIPRGQEAEMMGIYICSGQLLAWMPTLVFSVLNEAGISMRVAFSSLTLYFIVSFFLLFLVGDYDEAVAHARDFDHSNASNNKHVNHQHNNTNQYDHESQADSFSLQHQQVEAEFVIISDYEEAIAHKMTMSVAEDSDASSNYGVPQC